MGFANKLKELREIKKLSQEDLAKLCQVSTKTISRYELGQSKPRYRKTYDLLAEHLDTTHDYLVTDEDEFILKARENFGKEGAKDAEDMINGVIGLMAGGQIPDEDKRTILDAITEAYYIARAENDNKDK
ncbi:helix-turn-helix transcriptional regulator [uncultured Anaerococcus sp.]|uniref:helix-turn-helix domain-containing protein n=1 Tax=uncultured Anaerococcus sp. TaxID=293428 RepID=UPI00280BAA88|nr:helix-turn-helix transcriptional regulator [uncultured Anaerococcus sp.]MDU5150123.1 helix-turn-helix transcriptional regulator [Anaerococcus prevotii]